MSRQTRRYYTEQEDEPNLSERNDTSLRIILTDERVEYAEEVEEIPCATDEGLFFQRPKDKDNRIVQFIVGQSGIGKSTYTSQMIEVWLDIVGGRVYCVSEAAMPNDPVYREFFNNNEAEMIDPSKVTELDLYKNSLFVFDDFMIDDMKSPAFKLAKEIVEYGRKLNISCFIVSHQAAQGKSTSWLLAECDCLVFWPIQQSANMMYALTKHAGLDKYKLNRMQSLADKFKTRRIALYLKYPTTIIADNFVTYVKEL